MKNKNIKKLLWLFMCIIVVVIIYEIIHIYAVFYSEMSGNVQFENGKWNIYVNGTEISTGVTTSFTVDQISIDESSHVKAGNLAPGLSGDFEIAINPSDTDVSVRYDITLDRENMTNDNIRITDIAETEDNNTLTRTDEDTYTGIIPLQKIKNGITNNIHISIEWTDTADGTQDLLVGATNNPKLQIPITVHFSQYSGETITEYVETP